MRRTALLLVFESILLVAQNQRFMLSVVDGRKKGSHDIFFTPYPASIQTRRPLSRSSSTDALHSFILRRPLVTGRSKQAMTRVLCGSQLLRSARHFFL